jgi:hypothetical protein
VNVVYLTVRLTRVSPGWPDPSHFVSYSAKLRVATWWPAGRECGFPTKIRPAGPRSALDESEIAARIIPA